MIIPIKVRLEPKRKQASRLFQNSGRAGFVYNWTLARQEANFKNGGKFISGNKLGKEPILVQGGGPAGFLRMQDHDQVQGGKKCHRIRGSPSVVPLIKDLQCLRVYQTQTVIVPESVHL